MTIDLRKLRLGEILIEHGVITEGQLKVALNTTKQSGEKLGEVLISLGFITEKQLLETLSAQLSIPMVDLREYPIDLNKVKLISEDWATKFNVLVLGEKDKRLVIAMSNPLDYNTRDSILLFTDLEIQVVIVPRKELEKAIREAYRELNVESALGDIDRKVSLRSDTLNVDKIITDDDAPIITLLNNILTKAVTINASDIHFEPFETMSRVRMRVDGDLKEVFDLKPSTYTNLIARIKVVANLNTVERRLPQDGRINLTVQQQKIDFRISILPAYTGEKVVIRVFNQSQMIPTLEDLGFPKERADIFKHLITEPNGIILVTGPTGSGKTTTLYATLNHLNDIKKNITTVEDPIEYKLFGINQIQTNETLGLNFSMLLRSILRQDPDIIMIGEIRDEETARIATRAASTGHLVLSTLHTNDSVSAIARLIDIGIAPYLITDTLRAVLAQRLIKLICTECKESYPASDEEARRLSIGPGTTLYRGRGCSHCDQTGYKGRTAIYEMLIINSTFKQAVDTMTTTQELYEAAEKAGLVSLADACREKVLSGITSVSEYAKITFDNKH